MTMRNPKTKAPPGGDGGEGEETFVIVNLNVAADDVARQSHLASEADRVWFEQHPGVNKYVRPQISWEFGPFEPVEDVPLVEVIQVRSGLRIRRQL